MNHKATQSPGFVKKMLEKISPYLIIFGFILVPIILPELIVYNSTPFNLFEDALPYTVSITALVWVGFIFHKVRSWIFRIILASMTGFTTAILLLDNIVCLVWRWITFR